MVSLNLVKNNKLSHGFLLSILVILGLAVAWMFRPFLIDILLAGVLASFFYPVYQFALKFLKHPGVASFATTFLMIAIVVIPVLVFFIYLINQSIDGYVSIKPFLENKDFLSSVTPNFIKDQNILNFNGLSIIGYIGTFAREINTFLLNISSLIVTETTRMITSFLIIFLTIFFLFIRGKEFATKIMYLTPISNKYDVLLFKTFREVSYSTIVSTFVVAVSQGLLGGIGFWLAGLPGLFAGVLIAASSILPYIGTFIIWGPVVGYLFAVGRFTDAIILLVVGLIISVTDNLIRAYMIKGKVMIHELIIFFSIIGGILTFGFWGIVIGPLLLSLLFTVLHIYELEFAKDLDQS